MCTGITGFVVTIGLTAGSDSGVPIIEDASVGIAGLDATRGTAVSGVDCRGSVAGA